MHSWIEGCSRNLGRRLGAMEGTKKVVPWFCFNLQLPLFSFKNPERATPHHGGVPEDLQTALLRDKREGRQPQSPTVPLVTEGGPRSKWVSIPLGASFPVKGAGAISCWKVERGDFVWAFRATTVSLCFLPRSLLPPGAPGSLPTWRGRLLGPPPPIRCASKAQVKYMWPGLLGRQEETCP